ncbi:hypothetical protein NNC19_12770 [Clostridium sp. SHJSY1]|uniref:hypothetical protein n=1 Tax=Clostridium sp. SHJSY1 TaxID=2942483 RepID=UPI0028766DCF|nr:hypothetical protein [Clostridium sp. SHJSY1]MDS0526557.1 hypothetical protein [Clostridium sp. SHJSY1]
MEKTKKSTKIRLVSILMFIVFIINVIPINIAEGAVLLKTEKNTRPKLDLGNVLHYDGQVTDDIKKEETPSEKVVEKNQKL